MKKIMGLVVIIAALVLGGYYGTGLVTERTLKRNINSINDTSGLYVEIKTYDRGWFTSTAAFNVLLQVPERIIKKDGQSVTVPAQNYNLDIPMTIYHGPMMFTRHGLHFGLGYASSQVSMPQPFASQFESMFTSNSTKPQLDIRVLVNYFNKTKLMFQVPQFKLFEKEGGGQFSWLGMSNNVTISSSMDSIGGDLSIEGMTIEKDQVQAVVGSILSGFDLHRTKEGLFLGQAHMALPSITVKRQQSAVFELQDFKAQSSSSISSGLFCSTVDLSLEKVMFEQKTYGPGVLSVSVKNLDGEALAEINQLANKMQHEPALDRQQAAFQMLPQLPKLFSKGAEFQISKASLVVPEGTIEGHLLISLPKGEMGNPFQIIQKLQGDGEIKMPAVVVEKLMKHSLEQAMTGSDHNAGANVAEPAMDVNEQPVVTTSQNVESTQVDEKVRSLVNAGLLKKESNNFVIQVKLTDGQLTVNGQPFNPNMLKF